MREESESEIKKSVKRCDFKTTVPEDGQRERAAAVMCDARLLHS